MATYLDLTNQVLRRLNEEQLTSVNFDTAAGVHGLAKEAVLAAVQDISQRSQVWPWLKETQTITTLAGVVKYAPDADVRVIDYETFKLVRDDAATPPIIAATLLPLLYNPYIRYGRPLDEQMDADMWSVPRNVVRNDDNVVILSPPPIVDLEIEYSAWVKAVIMDAFDDVCQIPDDYRLTIIDGAMYYLYMFRTDTENADRIGLKFKGDVDSMVRFLIPQENSMYVDMVNNVAVGARASTNVTSSI